MTENNTMSWSCLFYRKKQPYFIQTGAGSAFKYLFIFFRWFRQAVSGISAIFDHSAKPKQRAFSVSTKKNQDNTKCSFFSSVPVHNLERLPRCRQQSWSFGQAAGVWVCAALWLQSTWREPAAANGKGWTYRKWCVCGWADSWPQHATDELTRCVSAPPFPLALSLSLSLSHLLPVSTFRLHETHSLTLILCDAACLSALLIAPVTQTWCETHKTGDAPGNHRVVMINLIYSPQIFLLFQNRITFLDT